MARRSRMRKMSKMANGSGNIEGLDHPKFTKSYYDYYSRYYNTGERHLARAERVLNRL